MIKRYDTKICREWGLYVEEVESPSGEWVKASDALELQKRLDAVEETLGRILKENWGFSDAEVTKELRSIHGDQPRTASEALEQVRRTVNERCEHAAVDLAKRSIAILSMGASDGSMRITKHLDAAIQRHKRLVKKTDAALELIVEYFHSRGLPESFCVEVGPDGEYLFYNTCGSRAWERHSLQETIADVETGRGGGW